MGVAKEDIDFDRRLSEKRHKEIIESLKTLASEMQKEKKDSGVIAAIEKQMKIIEGFVAAIKGIPKPEKPEVNVQVNQSEIVSSVERMSKLILQELSDLKAVMSVEIPPVEWEFKLNRNQAGYIDTVKVKSINNQIKAQA